MNCFTKPIIMGTVFACGLGLSTLFAQHNSQGDSQPGKNHKAAPAALPRCPIANEPVNLAVHIDADDGPVYFCCKGCIEKYQANPAKHATLVAAQRKALSSRPKIQVSCPVSQESVDQDVFVESNGQKVYFCCKDCAKKYSSNPNQYASALANSYTFQTKCPVMDEEINPNVFTTTASGNRVYFCCKGCDKKFAKNPGKYTAKLVAQGFTYEPTDLVQSKKDHKGHDHDGHNH